MHVFPVFFSSFFLQQVLLFDHSFMTKKCLWNHQYQLYCFLATLFVNFYYCRFKIRVLYNLRIWRQMMSNNRIIGNQEIKFELSCCCKGVTFVTVSINYNSNTQTKVDDYCCEYKNSNKILKVKLLRSLLFAYKYFNFQNYTYM